MNTLIKKLNLVDVKLFSGYVVFAGIATVVDLALLYSLTTFMDLHYLASAAIGYFFGMITNFTLNKTINFKNRSKKVMQQFGLFTVVALIGLGLNQLILWSLVEHADMWYMYAKVISIMIVMFWSFYGHKKITFGLLK